MFKSLNKGISAPIAIIIIIVCALLVGGIVVWQYLETPEGEEKITEIKPPNGEEEVKPSVVDCGTAEVPTSSFPGEYVADENTKKAWECFTDHIDSCTPAKIISTSAMGATAEYQILEKKGDICVISGPKLTKTGMENVTCEIPRDWIDFAFTEMSGTKEKFVKGFLAVSIISLGGKVQFPDKTFIAECK